MKTAFFIIFTSGLLLAQDTKTIRNQPPLPNGTTSGRYHLVAANVGGAAITARALFRIDTATGKVWRYHEVTATDKSSMDGWSETTENIWDAAFAK